MRAASIRDDLRERIRSKEIVVVAGSGVTAAATKQNKLSSWVGLIESGIERAAESGGREGKLTAARALVAEGTSDSLISGAELVTEMLGDGEFGRWLKDTVGSLRVEDCSLLDALVALNVPLATTNYDDLIEDISHMQPVTWLDDPAAAEGLSNGGVVVHLHGHWLKPESVILGTRSYERLLYNPAAQALQQAFAATRSLLFVGVGDGANDPNVAGLRRWLAMTLPRLHRRHFRLCRECELETLGKEHLAAERIIPIGYGEDHSELADYLLDLAHGETHQPTPASATEVEVESAELLDDHVYRDVARAYLRWASNEWRYIDLGDLGIEHETEDPRRVQRLPLQRMYISLQADPRSQADRRLADEQRARDESALGPEAADSLSAKEAIAAALARGPGSTVDTESGGQVGVSLEDAFAKHRLLVVLGNPGSGKTVMCTWLGSLVTSHSLDRGSAGSGQLRVPMRFRAADYAQVNSSRLANGETPCSVAEFLAQSLPESIGYSPAKLRAMFEQALANGQAVLLIDGLDEVTDHRNEVVDALIALVERYVVRTPAGDGGSANQVVITSRIAGYDDVRLAFDEAAHYVIRPMSQNQLELFVERFFEQVDASDQAALFLSYLKDSHNDAIHRLATSPLELTSMCSYWQRHHELPATRAALFRRLLVDTAYRWRFAATDKSSPLYSLLGDEDAFLSMLSSVAVRIHDEHEDGRIDEADLLDTLDDALFGSKRLGAVDTRPIGLELIDWIQKRIGVFGEVSPGKYGFKHQIYREYLLAHDLLKGSRPSHEDGTKDEPDGALFQQLEERIGDPRWREPLLMALDECTVATRVALAQRVNDERGLDLEEWVDTFLTAALTRSTTDTNTTELAGLIELGLNACDSMHGIADALDELDAHIADLRRHVGEERFDFVALSLFSDAALAPNVAALYWRRRWLTAAVLGAFAAAPQRDSLEWDWPIQRALRRAAAPVPLRKVEIKSTLDPPAPDETDENGESLRLFELGRRSWEVQHQRDYDERIDPVPPDALALRALCMSRPELWEACVADAGSARVLCTLFGGLDHHDALHWMGEYEDFARLISQPDGIRSAEIERRAAELVPRFGTDNPVYAIAVLLDSIGATVPSTTPRPAMAPSWMTCPSTPAVRRAAQRCLTEASGDSTVLSAELERLATAGSPSADRAEAELGLLVLDGRHTRGHATNVRALKRALESTSDAMIRGHSEWFEATWKDQSLTQAERAAAHRFLLRITFLVAGRPVPLSPAPLTLGEPGELHPVLQADDVARKLFRNGDEDQTDLELEQMPAERLLTIMAWLTTLPYGTPSNELQGGITVALWHEGMPRAGASSALVSSLRSVQAWAHMQAPGLEPQLSAAIRTALRTSLAQPSETKPQLLADLERLRAGDRVNESTLQSVRLVAQEVAGPHTDLAYLLVALEKGAPDGIRAQWQAQALEFLSQEPDQEQRAEALCRIWPNLCDAGVVQENAQDVLRTIESPILRATACGDLSLTAEALVDRLGDSVDRAARTSMLLVVRIAQELCRVGDSVQSAGSDEEDALFEDRVGPVGGRKSMAATRILLDREAVARIEQHLTEHPDDERIAQYLSYVSRVEDDAIAGLHSLLDSAPPEARWGSVARALLTLHRAADNEPHEGIDADLIELARNSDAAIAARAQLELIGPFRTANREERRYKLSRWGLDRWWEMGRLTVNASDPISARMLREVLNEWDVDDGDAVVEATQRAHADVDHRAIWRTLLDTSSIWRPAAQSALANWLATATPADPPIASACLSLVSILLTLRAEVAVVDELVVAVSRSCIESGLHARVISSLSFDDWRMEVAQPVADACLEAIGQASTPEAMLSIAKEAFQARTTSLIDQAAGEVPRANFAAYGQLMWKPVGAQPARVARFAPAELKGIDAIELLAAWARDLGPIDARSEPLALAIFEGVLNLLVVLSAREGPAYRRACPPATMQPLLSRTAVRGSGLAQPAALLLLGRLDYVDTSPTAGPSLIEVVEAGLLGEPQAYAAAVAFFNSVRSLRGPSLVDAVLDRVEKSTNETVAQGFAGLAAAYFKAPTCSNADRRLIQRMLKSADKDLGARRAIYLSGKGDTNDPLVTAIGPDRRTEFRRLRREIRSSGDSAPQPWY